MNTVVLTISKQPELYLETENITPDVFAGKSAEEIAALNVYEGNLTHTLGEYFTVAGGAGDTAADTRIEVKGDLTRVKWIGAKMTTGEVVIEGDSDMYTGAFMEGGKLLAKGNVGHFAGLGMKGGDLHVTGNAGNYLGAAYRGDWRGMMSGVLRVDGNAGSDIGTFMRGGEIIVGGDVDVHVGTHQEGGKIVVKGNGKSKIGGQMVKGDIYIFGSIDVMMPGFAYRENVDLEVDGVKATFEHYIGDLGERHGKSKGETIYGHLYKKL
ncbi:formylmethanofuran dehydrogenase subunit C [Methanoplanus sp. FWC-SCC4]|uniref:formylmethanofuran dehydrogenase n=1 Tax=Methanochimaera problematica TaxID=2609417 RepID=A0AA97I351_9EURY|nr:formylmethanofuran dehydrogenase subunit C [Methanoplanus sp. FWC-SCC4]WOF15299.1 formylmethanofuran dehydrogenase subunit C [Methanoplanus sp. FWC-SCC4]